MDPHPKNVAVTLRSLYDESIFWKTGHSGSLRQLTHNEVGHKSTEKSTTAYIDNESLLYPF